MSDPLSRTLGTGGIRRGSWRLAVSVLLALPGAAAGGESLQPGFYYHDPAGVPLRVTSARSGGVCTEGGEPAAVCEPSHRVVIIGDETCDYPPDRRYPCTWFGYEFDYAGATPGTSLNCTVTRTDPRGRRTTDDYVHRLDAATGHVFRADFRTYAPVDERLIFSEVHDCAYQGQRLSTVEYLIYYEPGAGAGAGSGTADGYFPELPDACGAPYLTETVAMGMLNARQISSSAANEHIPTFWSQCIRSGRDVVGRQVGYVFKYMLSDMFDVDRVERRQLEFNATFAAGGARLTEVREELGDLAFVFDNNDRSTLMVITGFKGPNDGAGRSQEFVATYYLEYPELTHDQRTGVLMDEAQRHLQQWHEGGR